MTERDSVLRDLKKYFPESVFQLVFDDKKDQYMVIRKMVVTNKKTKEVSEQEVHCLEFSIEGKEVVIKLILNCSIDLEFLGRGKDIVDRIVRFSKSRGYDTKIEYDVSKISVHGIEFSLRKLKLLSSGQTWYQSLQFQEANYEQNRRCIEEFIGRPIGKTKKTIRGQYSEIMSSIQSYSKKESLTEEDAADLRRMTASVDRKFREMEKACPATYENFHDLYYRGSMTKTPSPGSNKTRKRKRVDG
jgi:hypothetical protein